MQSKDLRDPFADWPALDLMEVEVTDSNAESSGQSDTSEMSDEDT